MLYEDLYEYLKSNATAPVQRHLLRAIGEGSTDTEALVQSKYYRMLQEEQQENGSYGRFHSMDSSEKKRRFLTTESALHRMLDLSMRKGDPVADRLITLLEKYIQGEENITDRVEMHNDGGKSFLHALPFMYAADLNLIDPGNPLIKEKQEVAVRALERAFEDGTFHKEIWDADEKKMQGLCLQATMAYPLWLLRGSNLLRPELEQTYMNFLYHHENGIYYVNSFAPAEKMRLEDKEFTGWLYALETLKGFSMFSVFLQEGVQTWLLQEAERLITTEVTLPAPKKVMYRYAENYRERNAQKNDLLLRIWRLLSN